MCSRLQCAQGCRPTIIICICHSPYLSEDIQNVGLVHCLSDTLAPLCPVTELKLIYVSLDCVTNSTVFLFSLSVCLSLLIESLGNHTLVKLRDFNQAIALVSALLP